MRLLPPLKSVSENSKRLASKKRLLDRKKLRNTFSGGGGISGGVNFGKDQNKAFVPIIVAIGAMLFFVFTFGGLFRKKRRR